MPFRNVLSSQSGRNLHDSLRPPPLLVPPRPRSRDLKVLQTHAPNSGIGSGHNSACRSWLPYLNDLTLTLGLVFCLPTLEARLPNPPDWGPRIPKRGLWMPPLKKLYPMILLRTPPHWRNLHAP